MNWLWQGGGVAMFDTYTFHHFAWFVVITLTLYPIFREHTWIGVISLALFWELLEYWVSANIVSFPFAGKELWINKWVGDPIANMFGYFTAQFLINIIKKHEEDGTKKN